MAVLLMLLLANLWISVWSLNPKRQHQEFDVVVDFKSPIGSIGRIWDNSGLSPPEPGVDAVTYLTSTDLRTNLALIGSLPFQAISHMRIHWMLDLVQAVYDGSKLLLDFSVLDELIEWLIAHRMRPGFELMGNPGKLFDELESDCSKVALWQTLVAQLATHFVGKFGEEVANWRFELWNEPDSKQYNILNLTTQGYLRYAQASIKGLASSGLRCSGPAGTFRDLRHHNLSWTLLHWCDSLIATIGRCPLDTITFHKKGEGDAGHVVSSSVEFLSTATSLYPHLRSMPFANNEADILSGWWREEEWRGNVDYATRVLQVLTSFRNQTGKVGLPLAYLSNDNGFMNEPPAYFNQRTLLTRFKMGSSDGGQSQWIRKPVMVAMGLLSYIGSKSATVVTRSLNCSSNCDYRLSVLAGTEREGEKNWSAAIIMGVSALTPSCSNISLHLRLRLPTDKELMYMVYTLDNEVTNPQKVWKENGEPDQPSASLLDEMRNHEGPHVVNSGKAEGEWQRLSVTVRCPSVTLVHVCARQNQSPAKIFHVHAINITFNEVLILWQDSDTKCVKTYEVYFCEGDCKTEEYKLINKRPIIMLAYQFRATPDSGSGGPEGTTGMYKVRLRDYWDRLGTFSDPLIYK